MSQSFDTEIGDFSSERAAEDWAETNGIDLRDIHTRNIGGGRVTLSTTGFFR